MPINCDPNSLATAARCFCADEHSQRAQVLFLLCRIFQNGGGSGSCAAQSGAGSPAGSATPAFIGQLYHDTTTDTYYRSTGLTSGDWTAIVGGASGGLVWGPNATVLSAFILNQAGPILGATATDLSFPGLLTFAGTDDDFIVTNSYTTSVSCPVLTIIGGGANADFSNSTALTSISMPSLVTATGTISAQNDTLLTSVDFTSLASVADDFNFNSCALTALALPSLINTGMLFDMTANSIVNFSAPLWIPTNGSVIRFSANALSAASVELILRRCVLAGVTTATIDLSGGTNAGTASLSAQGQADVATLGAQLTINP